MRPAIVRSVVVLPTELGPNNTKKRPSATLKDRFSRARTRPYDLLTFVKRSADVSNGPIATSQTTAAAKDARTHHRSQSAIDAAARKLRARSAHRLSHVHLAQGPSGTGTNPLAALEHRFGASEPRDLFSSVHRDIRRHRGRLNRTLTA